MISVDTSVVVRYLVGTPEDQAQRAARLVDGPLDIAISLVVVAESAHVLRSVYRLGRAAIVDRLIELMTRENVTALEISKADAIDALVRARAFESSPITDALIAAAGRSLGALPIYTFDHRFRRLGSAVATP